MKKEVKRTKARQADKRVEQKVVQQHVEGLDFGGSVVLLHVAVTSIVSLSMLRPH